MLLNQLISFKLRRISIVGLSWAVNVGFYLLYIFLFSCQDSNNSREVTSSEKSIQKDSAYAVQVITSKVQSFTYPIETKGKLQSSYLIGLSFPLTGQLASLEVVNSQNVKKGQLIATLVNLEYELKVEEKKVLLSSTINEYENKLAEYGDSTTYDNWPRVKKKIKLQSGVNAALVSVKQAEYNLSQTYLFAPYDGIIEGLEIKPGNWVNAQQKICTIMDNKQLEVVAEVLEFDLGGLSVGNPAKVYPLAYPGEFIEASVFEINPLVDNRGYLKVKLTFPYQQKLVHGMSARVVLEVPQSESLLIPKEAVVNKSGRTVIFSVEDGLAKWLYVTTGRDNGEQIEILEGLQPGTPVIVSNNLQLAHDSPVKIVNLEEFQ